MKVALVDNGSLEPAAHESLRRAAAEIGRMADTSVEAVSWRHSNRIAAGALSDGPARTLAPWVRAQVASGERDFAFIPFFISPQGAIGSLLRRDLDALRALTGGFEYVFTDGLATGPVLATIVAERVREAADEGGLDRPAVIVVDHGGPSRESAQVRDQVALAARALLGEDIGPLAAASMESPEGTDFLFNQPLLADALAAPGFNAGDVVIAPLFLSPGRHAGSAGDLARIARVAEARSPGLRCRFTGLIGSHPAAVSFLASALAQTLRAGVRP